VVVFVLVRASDTSDEIILYQYFISELYKRYSFALRKLVSHI